MKKSVLVFIVLILPVLVWAQNCRIVTASNKVCLGNTMLFTVTFDAGFTASSYAWNFGNSATSSQASPVYQYPARGVFTPTVTVNFLGGGSCTVSGEPIRVVGNPSADFNITTTASQCFKNNQVCITDLSAPGQDNAPIQTRLFLWGDGGFSNQSPPVGNSLCYNYSNPTGGVYTLTIEVYDTNNCSARRERKDAITVFAKMQEVSFRTNYTTQCFATPAVFTNTSKIPLSQVKSYQWDFGDSTSATSPWTGFTHTYTKTGIFTARLMVEDINGCRDTAIISPAGENYRLDSTIYLDKVKTCYNMNSFTFTSRNFYPGIIVNWAIYKVGNPFQIDSITLTNMDSVSFTDCGQFRLSMYVRLGNCSFRRDTLLEVLGPKAVVETPLDRVNNSIQCEIHDTVIFRGPPPADRSCFYQNSTILRVWDFDDPFAPPCTTDTKLNINVGQNCRYSKDSLNVWHNYTNGKERCYYPKLTLTDLATGCTHYDTTSLKLMAPDAGWDSTINPIRRGLYYTGIPCLKAGITFHLDETLPLCGREQAWIMTDTACDNATWIKIDSTVNTFDYSYQSTCSKDGKVTVGLIIKNGLDKNGNPCYDTAYYPVMFTFFPLDPTFDITTVSTGCGPFVIKVTLRDSIQDSLVKAAFTGSVGRTLFFGPTDSIIPSQYFTFPTPGIKRIKLELYNTRGCVLDFQKDVFFGFFKTFQPDKEIICLGDSVELKDNVSYYNSTVPYWKDPARAAAGKEQLYWDFGDGRGFATSGPNPKFKYTKVGNYRLRMVAVDSVGCRDTFLYSILVKVVDLQAAVKSMQARYLCAPQILSFEDRSIYTDSSALYNQAPYDAIASWRWDFGDNKTPSLLRNPVHAFTANGNYNVKLVVRTGKGCADSAFVPIFIDGPRPKFDIIGDTIGCAPFTVNLKNTTGYPLINWVWYFRDQLNSVASTKLDTNVKFTYVNPGTYKIYVVGEDTIFDPLTGNFKTCLAVFPDSLNPNAERRTVRVLPSIGANIIGPDTVCLNEPFDLIARPRGLYQGFNWYITDTSNGVQELFPDTVFTHTYNRSGVYRVKMFPLLSGNQCTDTSSKLITVLDVKADFEMDQTELPLVKFTNKSTGAVRYEWNFGHPVSGPKNFSTLENPTHNFVGDSGSFLVCLKAFNAQDCVDSICKLTLPAEIRIKIPNVFTPNNDFVNDAFDIDAVGIIKYRLDIFNRWGEKVYVSERDGFGNDGINWNGRVRNDGRECPEGTYFFVFNYQLANMLEAKEVHGTITLIRDK